MRTAVLVLICSATIGMSGCSAKQAELHTIVLRRVEAPTEAVDGLRGGDDISTIEEVIHSRRLLEMLAPTLAPLVQHPRDVLESVRIRDEPGRSITDSLVRQPVVVTIAGTKRDRLDAALRQIVDAVNRSYPKPVFEAPEPPNPAAILSPNG